MPRTAPKPEGQRRRANAPTFEWNEFPDTPFTGAPDLGRMAEGSEWPDFVQTWWATISTMPHCAMWEASDWSFARLTAPLVLACMTGSSSAASELRQRERVMGVTVDGRMYLRIRYVPAGASDDGPTVADEVAAARERRR
jgi:hypothetical protein